MSTKVCINILCSLGFTAILSGCATDGGAMKTIPNPFAASARFDLNTTGSTNPRGSSVQQSASSDMITPSASASGSVISSAPLTSPATVASSTPKAQPGSQSDRTAAVQSQKVINTADKAGSSGTTTATGNGYWTPEGGSHIFLIEGETLRTISDRYGVPISAIRKANRLSEKSSPTAGTKLIIPVYKDGSASSHSLKSEKMQSSLAGTTRGGVATDAVGDAKKGTNEVSVANSSLPDVKVTIRSDASPAADATRTNGATSGAKATIEAVGFRWPAKGRVVAGFGNVNGVKSTGIKIALPVGTQVKASEAGTVAYSGSEVKGYGNMIIVRHSEGWVSVYANNGELKVKRGDSVTRGQVIALSGQSGDVSSPQLHFELRKGSTPVDPMGYFSEN